MSRRALITVVFGFACVACGPIEYISHVTRRAATGVAGAKQARADQFAPYEYTLAVEYLRKAREEGSYSNFENANRYGRKAAEAAERAQTLAQERQSDPERARRELPPPILPQRTGPADAPADEDVGDAKGVEEIPDALGSDE